MATRIIFFLIGAIFGAFGAIIQFHWFEKSEIHWGIVALAGLVLGTLSALFGKKFWDTAISLWP